MSTFPMIAELQKVLSTMVISTDLAPINSIRQVCGVDVSYHMNVAFSSVVNMDRYSFDSIEIKESRSSVEFPYISGFFMLREASPIFTALKKLKSFFDVLIVNGHGVLHPRRMGLASFIGLLIDKPTIGIAKRLLCGIEDVDNYISIDHDICGKKITGKGNSHVYVSVGHKISLETSINLVMELFRDEGRFPEPLKTADLMSKKARHLYMSQWKK